MITYITEFTANALRCYQQNATQFNVDCDSVIDVQLFFCRHVFFSSCFHCLAIQKSNPLKEQSFLPLADINAF